MHNICGNIRQSDSFRLLQLKQFEEERVIGAVHCTILYHILIRLNVVIFPCSFFASIYALYGPNCFFFLWLFVDYKRFSKIVIAASHHIQLFSMSQVSQHPKTKMKFIVALALCVAVAVAAPPTYDSAATIVN